MAPEENPSAEAAWRLARRGVEEQEIQEELNEEYY